MTSNDHEYSRVYESASLLDNETSVTLNASSEECEAIADRLDILSLAHFRAELKVLPWKKTGLRVTGQLTAKVEQACSVTLEPVPDQIKEDIDIRYLPKKDLKKLEQDVTEEMVDFDQHDPPELLTESLDLGSLAVEFLALALNPYPRKQGASLDENALQLGKQGGMSAGVSSGKDIEEQEGPFSALGKWKNRLK